MVEGGVHALLLLPLRRLEPPFAAGVAEVDLAGLDILQGARDGRMHRAPFEGGRAIAIGPGARTRRGGGGGDQQSGRGTYGLGGTENTTHLVLDALQPCTSVACRAPLELERPVHLEHVRARVRPPTRRVPRPSRLPSSSTLFPVPLTSPTLPRSRLS